MCRISLFLALAFFLAPASPGQTVRQKARVDQITAPQELPESATLLRITDGDSVVAEHVYDPQEEVRVIVRLQAPSQANVWAAAASQADALSALPGAESTARAQQDRLAADLAELDARLRSASGLGGASRIGATYVRAFNGVALTTTREIADHVARLPYVRQVRLDHVYTIDATGTAADPTVPFPTTSTATGAGVVVGVLDSGIDYARADLGGGFGPGFKVRGGYDFINGDADPMDDNFHGTAVAGIIAADGADYRGLAPRADLLALKVCDSSGQCPTSAILEAIDWALDPDGTPSTDDAADVLNLSLGSSFGNADDPVAVALDGATAMGTVSVVSAGNDGHLTYHGVGGIAATRTAITVGATTYADDMAAFSSRGPTAVEYAIKPEIVAPGVGVPSSALGGTYGAYDGTSFSAPIVAGAVAHVMETHPTWSPARIKAALVQSSVDLGFDLWTQGAGRLDLDAAVQRSTGMTPATLSLGLVDRAEAVWRAERTVTLHNDGGTTLTYSLGLEGPPGMSATFSPSSVTLAPGTSQAVEVRFAVNTAVLGDNDVADPEWQPHSALVVATSGSDRIEVPVSLTQSPSIRVTSDDLSLVAVIVHDGEGIDARDYDGNRFGSDPTLLVPPGEYDVLAWVSSPEFVTFDVAENVTVDGAETVRMQATDLVTTYDVALQDEVGGPLPPFVARSTWFGHDPSGVGLQLSNSDGRLPHGRFSAVTGPYRYDWRGANSSVDSKVYHSRGSLTRFDRDVAYTNAPDDFRGTVVRHRMPAEIPEDTPLWPLLWEGYVEGAFASYGFESPTMSAPYLQQVFLMADPDPDYYGWAMTETFTEVMAPRMPPTTDRQNADALYVTPTWTYTEADGLQAHYPWVKEGPLLTVPGTQVTYGLGPTHWFGRFDNPGPGENGEWIQLRSATDRGFSNSGYRNGQVERTFPFFLNQFQDIAHLPDMTYTLLDEDGAVVREGRMANSWRQKSEIREDGWRDTYVGLFVESRERYTLVVADSSYTLGGARGHVEVRATMDLRLDDRNPPSMTALNVISAGEFTDRVMLDAEGRIGVRLTDAEGPFTAEIHTRPLGGDWTALQAEESDGVWTAPLAVDLAEGLYDVRVMATDAAGNVLEYSASPGFLKSDALEVTIPTAAPALRRPLNGAVVEGPADMRWNAVPVASDYRVVVARDLAFTDVVLDSVTTRLRLVADLAPATEYFWHVRGEGAEGAGPWSAARSFVTATTAPASAPDLLAPDAEAADLDNPVAFAWGAVEGGTTFTLHVATDAGFTNVVVDSTTTSTVLDLDLARGQQHHWRVRAENEGGEGPWSPVRAFEVAAATTSEGAPLQFQVYAPYPNPARAGVTLSFDLPDASGVRLDVFDSLGRQVATLLDEDMPPGRHAVAWQTVGVPSGIYMYRLTTSTDTEVGRMTLLR